MMATRLRPTPAPAPAWRRCGDGIRRQDLAEGEAGFEARDDGNPVQTDDCLSSSGALLR